MPQAATLPSDSDYPSNFTPNLGSNYAGAAAPQPTIPPAAVQYVPGGAAKPPSAAPTLPSPQIASVLTRNPDNTAGPAVLGSATSGGAAPPQTSPMTGTAEGGFPTNPYAPWSTDQIAARLVANPETALTPAQAHGVARALHDRESGGNPNAYNPAGGGAGAYGIEQARAGRQRSLLSLYGPTPTTAQQVDFATHEFVSSEKSALAAIKNATTEAAAYDATNKYFERSGGRGAPPPGEMQAGATPDFHEMLQRNQETYQRDSEALHGLMAEADKAAPGSQERHQLMQQAMEHSRRLEQTFEDMAAHPPTEKPIDVLQNFGSLATIVALFGGLLAKRPLTAALNAAGAAMQAKNTNNEEQFQRAYKMWDDQTALVSKAMSFQNQEINQIIEDEHLSESERQQKLEEKFRLFGMQHALDQSALGNWADVYKMLGANQKAAIDLDRTRAQVGYYNAKTQQLSGPGGTGYEASKTLEVMDKDGNVVRTVLAREGKNQPGWVDSTTGNPLKLAPGEHVREITPSTGGGGRAGAQVLRQEIGGREVLSDLQNAVSMPVGSTTGVFGTYQPGPSVMDALHGDLVRQLTSQDAQLMQASMASISRELSILMSPVYGGNWAAQQIDPLIPKQGDTVGTTIFKLARLAQSADNALEAVSKTPVLSGEQKAFALDLRKQIQTAIPWTSAQAMAFARHGQTHGESFQDFVKSHNVSTSAAGTVRFQGRAYKQEPAGAIDVPDNLKTAPDGKIIGDGTTNYIKEGARLILLIPAQ